MTRPTELRAFYAATSAALGCTTAKTHSAAAAGDRILAGLDACIGEIHRSPAKVDACSCLPAACARAARGPNKVAELGVALRKLSPALRWQVFRHESIREPFASGHAEAIIAGPEGLEQRDDIVVGASLLVPGVAYPVHRHAPEEVYIVLTGGEWYDEDQGWYTPNIGGIVYHRPWLEHAVRSGTTPLLTVWCLRAQ